MEKHHPYVAGDQKPCQGNKKGDDDGDGSIRSTFPDDVNLKPGHFCPYPEAT